MSLLEAADLSLRIQRKYFPTFCLMLETAPFLKFHVLIEYWKMQKVQELVNPEKCWPVQNANIMTGVDETTYMN
jgi:hypothetical protein